PTIVKWTKGGKQVYVTGSFNSWKSKIPMLKSPSSNEHSVTLYLPAGTHRFKFIVDGEWRCSTDLPTAQDNDGVMVNYVEVMSSRTPSSSFKEPSKLSSSASSAYPDSPPGSYSSSIPHFLRHPHLSSSPPIAPASFVSSASSSPDTTIPPLLPPQLTKVLLNSNNTSKDDPTILPMPNHVVLNHLYACSIRDGVMAVASTMRYRKK
ncbi:immunoglobulin E-set, partial [Paraphysoderma sedebokerense]